MTKSTTLAFAIATTTASLAHADDTKFSPGQLVDALHAAFGTHAARAVHAKGIILEGSFVPDPGAAALTVAAHLQRTASKVTLRFSDFTGIPDIADNNPSANPRGIAIRFTLPGGASTDLVGHSFDGFPTATSDEFRELLMAIASGGPAVDKFLATHPIAKTFLTTQKTPASYATIAYFGVNSFEMTNAGGGSKIVRYQILPEGGAQELAPAEASKRGPNYLQEEIAIHKPFRFKLYAQLAEAGDKTGDPSIAWPATRTKILLGTIAISGLAANTAAQDKALAYSPLNLPDGIRPADPMLEFRSKAYPISVAHRR